MPGGPLDVTAPTATITSPEAGETVGGGSVTVSGTASDIGGIVARVQVSTDDGATWQQASGTTAWTYTFSASDGSFTVRARAIDDAANVGAPDNVTFEVGPQVCPCSIWTPAQGGGSTFTDGPVELGVKFRADTDGFITAIRFWKPSGATGTHIGRLWTSAGTSLGDVTFGGETASGWQEASFGAPIAIDADTTYIASYHAPAGYSSSQGFFVAGVDSPPLHALQTGVDGLNGVYRYGAAGSFPIDSFQSSNYWVDVVFMDDIGPDETPPTITARAPTLNANGISVAGNVTATFSEQVAPATIGSATFELRDSNDALVGAAISYDSASRTATLNPSGDLDYSTTYTATVSGGAGGVTDVAGNPLAADEVWSFTTSAPPPPPPNTGPGGPVLVVSSGSNPFSSLLRGDPSQRGAQRIHVDRCVQPEHRDPGELRRRDPW